MSDNAVTGTERLKPRCFNPNCDKTFDSVNEMVAVPGRGSRSPRHFCESCAESVHRGPLMTDGGNDTSGTERFEKRVRREIHRCSECDEFELEKRFSGVAGTLGEEEYDRIEAPDQCPVCGGEIESEVV